MPEVVGDSEPRTAVLGSRKPCFSWGVCPTPRSTLICWVWAKAEQSGDSPCRRRPAPALGVRSTVRPCPLGSTPPPAPSALAKRLSPRGHDPASLMACHYTHTLFPRGSAQAAAPSRSTHRGSGTGASPPCLAPAALTAGAAASALEESSGSPQRRARGERRSNLAAEAKKMGARDGGAVRERQKSLTRHTVLFQQPRGAGDRGAHLISLQPLHHSCTSHQALAPAPA